MSSGYKQTERYFPTCTKPCSLAEIINDQLSNFNVTDRQSFIVFIDLLRRDFLQNPNGWKNRTIDDFLEALGAYANDIQGYYNNMGESVNADEPSWQTFGDIFKGAAMYE